MKVERRIIVCRFVISIESEDKELLAAALRHVVDGTGLQIFRRAHQDRLRVLLAELDKEPPA